MSLNAGFEYGTKPYGNFYLKTVSYLELSINFAWVTQDMSVFQLSLRSCDEKPCNYYMHI